MVLFLLKDLWQVHALQYKAEKGNCSENTGRDKVSTCSFT